MTPKEEPKQIKCYCGHTTYCDCGPEEPKIKNNMTPKEKAEELVERMFSLSTTNAFPAKQCALIAVDEIIKNMPEGFYSGIRPDYKGTDLEYWQEVKQEIEKL